MRLICRTALLLGLLASAGGAGPLRAAEPAIERVEDVIYGRKYGVALTMDVFKPTKDANGAAILWVVSGGYFSSHDAIQPAFVAEYTRRGYTVFAVVHGSQPKFTVPEIVDDMRRSARFIRYHAKDYGIDPDRLGVTGASAGGHLSLMLGVGADKGNAQSKDPVEQTPCRVAAVACFFPPTDFLNYGQPGVVALGRGPLKGFKAPFDFHVLDPGTNAFEPITDEAKILEIGKQISPIYHVTAAAAPTLIIHGDADSLVPIQQSESIVAKFKEAGATAKLVVKPGASHGWLDMGKDLTALADWFDEHLKPGQQAAQPAGEKAAAKAE